MSESNATTSTTTAEQNKRRTKRQYKEEAEEGTAREVAALIDKMQSNPELVSRTKHLKGLVFECKRKYKLLEICSAAGLLLVSLLCSTLLRRPGDLAVQRSNYRLARSLLCTTGPTLWLALFLLAAFLALCFVFAEDLLNTAPYKDIATPAPAPGTVPGTDTDSSEGNGWQTKARAAAASAVRWGSGVRRNPWAQALAKLCLTEAIKVAVGWGELAAVAYLTERKIFNSLGFVLAVAPRPAFCAYFAAFLHALFDAQFIVFKAFASLDKLAFHALVISSVMHSTAAAIGIPFSGVSTEGVAVLAMLAVLTAALLYPVMYYVQVFEHKGFSYPNSKTDMSIVEDSDDSDDDDDDDDDIDNDIDVGNQDESYFYVSGDADANTENDSSKEAEEIIASVLRD